jgi:dynein heavy chain 2
VDVLSREAGQKQVLLSKKQKEANEAMKHIQISMEQKAERKQEVEKLQARCAKDENAIVTRKGDVENELGGV